MQFSMKRLPTNIEPGQSEFRVVLGKQGTMLSRPESRNKIFATLSTLGSAWKVSHHRSKPTRESSQGDFGFDQIDVEIQDRVDDMVTFQHLQPFALLLLLCVFFLSASTPDLAEGADLRNILFCLYLESDD